QDCHNCTQGTHAPSISAQRVDVQDIEVRRCQPACLIGRVTRVGEYPEKPGSADGFITIRPAETSRSSASSLERAAHRRRPQPTSASSPAKRHHRELLPNTLTARRKFALGEPSHLQCRHMLPRKLNGAAFALDVPGAYQALAEARLFGERVRS